MPRYFIQISFKGTNYHGWQVQPNSVTVQSELNNALSIILKEEISATGAGRTDTGVHASFFIAHFDSSAFITEKTTDIIFRINRFLPGDIRVHSIKEVNENWHARFHAIKRTYQYVIAKEKTVFNDNLSSHWYGSLNTSMMNKAASLLKEYTDFTSFSRLHGSSHNNICKLIDSYWFSRGEYLIYKVSADRFLRNMVRAIVGTLIDVGKGKIDLMEFQQIIEAKDRCKAGTSAVAKGLFLTSILYPEEFQINSPKEEFPEFFLI